MIHTYIHRGMTFTYFSIMMNKNTLNSKVKILLWTFSSFLGVRGPNQMSLRACSYGGEPARLPGWPGRRDSFHLVFIWRNSSPFAETEI